MSNANNTLTLGTKPASVEKGGDVWCGVAKNCPVSVPQDQRKKAYIAVSL